MSAQLYPPVSEFLNWFEKLNLDQKLRISIDLLFTVPGLATNFDPLHRPATEAPKFYLLEQTTSGKLPVLEVLGRIGVLKTLVDVFCSAPANGDVTQKRITDLTITYAARKTNTDPTTEMIERLAKEAHGAYLITLLDQDEALYTSWDDLTSKAGPLSASSLYQWATGTSPTTKFTKSSLI